MAMSRASRQRRATSAATTTSPSDHNAPSAYKRRKNDSSWFGRPLSVVNRFCSNAPGSSWCQMAKTRMPTPITRRIQSLVRRRYGCSDAGPNECERHVATRDGRGASAGGASVAAVIPGVASQTGAARSRNAAGQRGRTTSGRGCRYSLAAFSQHIMRSSSSGMCPHSFSITSWVSGHVPSPCGKSVSTMMFSTPMR